MSEKAVEKKVEDTQQETNQAEVEERVYSPRIDISEDNDKLVLAVDMPGTDSKTVDISIEKNTLTIEGTPKVEAPEGYELVSREYSVGKYRRDFTLSNDVDADKITAKSRNGVLEVVIPKREERKARKIKIG